jgi:hypothetical protein
LSWRRQQKPRSQTSKKPPKKARSELIEEALDYHKQGYSLAEIGAATQ